MAPNSNAAYHHQTAHPRVSRRSVTSPYPPIGSPAPATPLQPRDPPVCDLFAALLFDRQRAHQSSSYVSSAPPSAPAREAKRTRPTERDTGTRIHQTLPLPIEIHVHEEPNPHRGHASLRCNLKSAMLSKTPTVDRKRGRPAKQTPTKDAGKTTIDEPRKRAAPPRLTLRATKRSKPEANSKQKLDNKDSMGNGMTKPDEEIEIITISDSEDDEYQPMRIGGTSHKKKEATDLSAPRIEIHEDDDDDMKPVPSSTANIGPTQLPGWAFNGLDVPDSELDLQPGPLQNSMQNGIALAGKEKDQEREKLHQELITTKTQLENLKKFHEKERSNGELMQVRSNNITKQEMQRIQQELEAERRNAKVTIRERDQLRIDLDNSRARNDQLAGELQEEKRLKQVAQKEHEGILEDVMRSKEPPSDSSNDFLVTENGRLRTENESLRVALLRSPTMPQSAFQSTPSSIFTPPSSQPSQLSPKPPYPSIFASESSRQLFSPAPSSVTSSIPTTATEERKEQNLRQSYSRLRKRFDSLHLAAGNLTNSTRGMDLTSFGQFGQYVRQLRAALDEDGKKVAAKKEEDDAK